MEESAMEWIRSRERRRQVRAMNQSLEWESELPMQEHPSLGVDR